MIYLLFAVLLLGVNGQGDDCLDAVPTCAKLAELGYCDKNELVAQRCRRSCNTDSCADGSEETPAPVEEGEGPGPEPEPEACDREDTSTTCPRLAELGYCPKNALVRQRCMKSCNTPCPPDGGEKTPSPTKDEDSSEEPRPGDCLQLTKRLCKKPKNSHCTLRYNKVCDNAEEPWVPENCSELTRFGSKKVCTRLKTSGDIFGCELNGSVCQAKKQIEYKAGTNCKKLKLGEQACKKVRGCRWGQNKSGKGKCKGKVREKK